jgi:hypothetical protein
MTVAIEILVGDGVQKMSLAGAYRGVDKERVVRNQGGFGDRRRRGHGKAIS